MQGVSNTKSSLILSDGRQLSWTECGDETGFPLLYCHGMCSTGCESLVLLDEPAKARGLRVIAPDRPGYGASSPARNYSLIQWVDDIKALARKVKIDEFFATGYSGGGPYAAALAWGLPTRVRALGLVASLSAMADVAGQGQVLPWYHPQRIMLMIAVQAPWLVFAPIRVILFLARRDLSFLLRRMAAADQRVGEQPLVQTWFRQIMLGDALQQGIQGVTLDMAATLPTWPFRLEEIDVPAQVWVGGDDLNCPPAMSRALARRIPGARLNELAGEGHLLAFARMPMVLDALLGSRPI